MFESTYDMLIHEGQIKGEAIGIQKGEAIGIQKGEAIGIRKGELMLSLDNILYGIVYMNSLNDRELARFSKLPETFVTEMRGYYLKKEWNKAQQAAANLFTDLPGISENDLEEIKKKIIKTWMEQRAE